MLFVLRTLFVLHSTESVTVKNKCMFLILKDFRMGVEIDRVFTLIECTFVEYIKVCSIGEKLFLTTVRVVVN